jgi:hypothetical protein
VLARPEFHPQDQLIGRLPELLRRMFGWLGELSTTAPLLYFSLLGGCLVLLGLIVFLMVRTVHRVFFLRERSPSADEAAAHRSRLSAQYRQEAEERAARGDFTEAIRLLFLSLLYRLDEDGRILFQRAYTNREYLALFADRPQLVPDLRVFVEALDTYWYGQQATDRELYKDCLERYDHLLRRA